MDFISERINNLTPSATLAMSQKSAELRAAGIDVINMSIGEPDFNTPDFIKEAAKVAIDENYTHYPPVPGYMTLRKAISEKLSRENGVGGQMNTTFSTTLVSSRNFTVCFTLKSPSCGAPSQVI